MSMNEPEILLIYDKQCPVCDAYCRALYRTEPGGSLRLIDAREPTALMQEITRQGLDIDQGMVVKVDGTLHYGANAIHVLARLSRAPGIFSRLNRWLFRTERRSRIVYPMLRSARNLLLKAMRRTRINNLRLPNNDRF